MSKRTIAKRKAKTAEYVIARNNAYGNKLKGTKIYFEGKRPSGLKDDGMISFGKHILELLGRKYDRFRWIITEETDSITTERGIVRVRTTHSPD